MDDNEFRPQGDISLKRSINGRKEYLSKAPFPGCQRYSGIRKDGSIGYIYTNFNLKEKSKFDPKRLLIILLYIPFIIFAFQLANSAFENSKNTSDTKSLKISVEDNVGAISDNSTLIKTLTELKSKTGTNVIIKTFDISYFNNTSDIDVDLDKCYNEYTNKNVLLMYFVRLDSKENNGESDSWYVKEKHPENSDWFMDRDIASKLIIKVQDNIEANKGSLSPSITGAFNYINDINDYRNGNGENVSILVPIFVFIFLGVHIYFIVIRNPYKEYKNYELDETYFNENEYWDNGDRYDMHHMNGF